MTALINLGTTPYAATPAYNPDTPISDNQTRYNTYNTVVTALAPTADWQTAVNDARSKVDESATFPKIDFTTNDLATNAIANMIAAAVAAMTNTNITAQADAHETRMTPRFLRSVSRFAGGMLDINAVNSSAFVLGLALLEREVLADAADFDAGIAYKAYDSVVTNGLDKTFNAAFQRQGQRNVAMAQGINTMIASIQHKVDAQRDASHQQAELNRIKIIAKKEQVDKDIELDVEDALWDIKTFQYGGNLLASIAGGTSNQPQKPSQLQSALSGAISGAAAGAKVGGLLGAGIGALVGGLAGLL
jgi:hypothetical protein